MGSKREIKYIVVCVIVILLGVIVVLSFLRTRLMSIDYSDILIDKLSSQEQVTVKDIFSFDFNKAYVFKDSYISGEGFSKAYNLDISISQVENTDQEYIGRVVFVDDSGNFVFEYQYNKNELMVMEEGVIIYPNTIIQKCESVSKGVFFFEFISSEYY